MDSLKSEPDETPTDPALEVGREVATKPATTIHERAEDMCRQLDSSLAGILPVQDSVSLRVPVSCNEDEVALHIDKFAKASRWLGAYFRSLKASTSLSKEELLQKEVEDLESELMEKEALMDSCAARLASWKERLERLKRQHEERQAAV